MKTHVHLAHVIFSLHEVIHVLHLDVIRSIETIIEQKVPCIILWLDVVGRG